MSDGTPTMQDDGSGWSHMLDWAYVGVDHSLPGNGGQECVDFLPLWQRVAESLLACLFAAVMMVYSIKRITLPEKVQPIEKSDHCGKRILLVSMCLTFGIELGFKFATKQIIWIFNPCHVTSMIQIYLLAAPPSKFVTTMFRMHLHMLTGAPIAILFPVINTRLLPFETEVYFIQHILMMIIPFYLMKIGGVYTPEPLKDMSWGCLTLGWLYFFHFVPLQYLAVLSQVNLNNMLCPAVSDPFYGRTYRLYAMTHEVILLPGIGKIIVYLANCFKLPPPSSVPEKLVFREDNSVNTVLPPQTQQKPVVQTNGHSSDKVNITKPKNGYIGGESGDGLTGGNGHIKHS